MARLYIMREKSMAGMWAMMDCYVNNRPVCSVKNGGDATFDVEDNSIIAFKCKMLNNPESETVYIDFTNKKMVSVSIKQGVSKPVVQVLDKSAITNKSAVFSKENDLKEKFKITKTYGERFAIDEDLRKWTVVENEFNRALNNLVSIRGSAECFEHIYDFGDIIAFELLEDGNVITKGGLGRALVGAAIFGGTGAVVGATTGTKKSKQLCTNLSIKITVNNMVSPVVYIKLITKSTPKESTVFKKEYANAQEILSALQLICNEQSKDKEQLVTHNDQGAYSAVDEIRKYKELFDEGIITEEEFIAKKKALLGL